MVLATFSSNALKSTAVLTSRQGSAEVRADSAAPAVQGDV